MKFPTENLVMLFLYVVIIGTLVYAIAVADDNILNYDNSSNSDKSDVSMVLVLSAFIGILVLFAIYSIALILISKDSNMYRASHGVNTGLMISNAMLATFGIIVLLPAIAALIDLGEDSAFSACLITGGVLSIAVGLFVFSKFIYLTNNNKALAFK